MDINEHLNIITTSLIENLKTDLTKELQAKITNEVIDRVASLELENLVNTAIKTELNNRLVGFNFYERSTIELNRVVSATVEHINKSLIQSTRNQIISEVNNSISNINMPELVNSLVKTHLTSLLTDVSFPLNSIPHTAINFSNLKLTGDTIKGGIIEDFGSTGIEDRTTFVQLTLMDHASVFEGPIYSPEIQIKGSGSIEGDLKVNGNLIILGELPTDTPAFQSIVQNSAKHAQTLLKETLNDQWFSEYSRVMFKVINETGLDLDIITQGGKEIIKGNQLGYHITDTNIQRLGHVLDLQTRGEALLCDTLYVTGKRAGINTLDPSATFVVWDEECEVIVTKRRQDTPYIGTSRNQSVILGSNNKDNIQLNVDGSITVQNLIINKVSITSALDMPSHNAPRGQIVFNEHPDIGKAVGWVSLGGARWAEFGKIE